MINEVVELGRSDEFATLGDLFEGSRDGRSYTVFKQRVKEVPIHSRYLVSDA